MTNTFTQAAFRMPSNDWRSVPFYSLNDELDPDEIRRQLAVFKEGGMGGTFLHSRIGLLTEYLGERWFQVITAGVKCSQELGLDAWFYDEDLWPSGFAGGIVPLQNPDFQARSLLRLNKSQPVTAPDVILFGDENYNYVCHVFPLGDSWFNGTSWVDLLNSDTVKAFIDSSYAPYAQKFGGQRHVPGIFTDEPQFSPRPKIPHVGAVAFSPRITGAFRARNGYDLIPCLPSLFAEVGSWRTIRLDYYRTLAHCFEQSFSRQIGDYCTAHGLVWTGHYNGEDSPAANMVNTGDLMQQLRHMHMPGIDCLGLKYGSVHCGKVMTSCANQYGKHRRLSELFGISGHNLNFEDRMWITAWHTLMGINFMCPHLSLYSMKGERKRDYPPTISAHQPWWRYNRHFEDYSARLCYFAGTGRTVAEICVLSPIESNYIEEASDPTRPRDQALDKLLCALMQTHRNFDLGDEQIISEIANVEGGSLVIGSMAYRMVILPDMLTLRDSTLALLGRFAGQGGTVLVSEKYPQLIDGEENPARLSFLKSFARLVELGGWTDALQIPRPFFTLTGEGNGRVWSHLRQVANGHVLQLSNTSRLESCSLNLSFESPGTPAALWDPVDGRCLRLMPGIDGTYALVFAPAQTWIVTTGTVLSGMEFDDDYHVPPSGRSKWMTLDGAWTGRRLDPNAMTLDYARTSIDGGTTWSEPEPVLAIYDRFAQGSPTRIKLSLMFEPWITDPPRTCKIAVEQTGMYDSVTVNGIPVNFDGSCGYFLDPVLRTQDITGLLKTGRNAIILTLDFISAVPHSTRARARYGTEIESIYLVGDFAVQAGLSKHPLSDTYRNQTGFLPPKPVHSFTDFKLVDETPYFDGDLATQGYPFYAGEFELGRTFELSSIEPGRRILLSFPDFEAVVLNITMNGRIFPPLFAGPWEVDVTDALQTGTNKVVVSVTNSLRNLLGPHHHKGGEHIAVGPATFRANHKWPNTRDPGESDWYDARREGRARSWRDDYYMIPLGFLQPPVLIQQVAPTA